MYKQFKNLILYDIPPNEDEFLANPWTNLKKLLLDRNTLKNGVLSRYNSIEDEILSCSSSSVSYGSVKSIAIIDDGNVVNYLKVLKLVLAYLPNEELLKTRLVSLRWNAVSCSILRSRSFHTRIPPSKLKRYLKMMHSNISNPFTSYAIRIDQIRDKNNQRLLNLISSKVVHLSVRLNIRELPDFSKVLQKMKCLEKLRLIVFDEFQDRKVNTYTDDKYASHMHLPSIRGYYWNSLRVSDESGAWELGLYSFPSIRKIHFESADDSYRIHPFYDQIIANIITACSHLKEMRFQNWNSPLGNILSKLGITSPGIVDDSLGKLSVDDVINLFFHLNLRFHHVSLQVTPEVRWELLHDVIHKLSETLQELNIVNEDIFERFILSSSLRRLVKLRLGLWRGPVDFIYLSRQLPSMRQISLNLTSLYEIETDQVKLGSIEPFFTVKTLTLTRLDIGVDVGLMEKLAMIFPNVKELFVEVKSGKVLEKIYEIYPEIHVLCVELNNSGECDTPPMTNQCFTGIPDELMKVVNEKECGCPEIEFFEEERSCWNIGCLKNLHTLLIRVPNTVNNISLLEGISRLENLQNLVLLPFYYNGEEPTKWCLRSIADNFHRLKTLVTSTEVEYDDSELEYLRSRMPRLVHKKRQ